MKQVTAEMCFAMEHNVSIRKGNTAVQIGSTANYAYLHGNLIAAIAHNRLYLRSAGWETVTTKDRLNGLLEWFQLPYRIIQGNFIWYLVEKGGDPVTFEKCYSQEASEGLNTFSRFVEFNLSTLKLIEPCKKP